MLFRSWMSGTEIRAATWSAIRCIVLVQMRTLRAPAICRRSAASPRRAAAPSQLPAFCKATISSKLTECITSSAEERDRIADLKAAGLSLRAIARVLGRAASTISRELLRNALDSGAYRPHVADGAYMLRRQRGAALEIDLKRAVYVTDRLSEGWTPEQIAGRLRLGIETGLRAVCAETIYGWIYRAGQKAERLWRFLSPRHARRRQRHARASRDTIAEKAHISQRSDDADARETVGHWEADLVICKRSRPVLAGAARAQDPDHPDVAPRGQDRGRDGRRDDGHLPAARP